MATYPLPTLAAALTSTGMTAPSYSDILASLQASAQSIYGADVYLEPDSQDGQLLAVFARAIHDSNQAAIAVYLAFSPATAQGVNLSNIVKINHITRQPATNSQVNVTVTGTAGTTILDGIVGDDLGNKWALPASVIIPPAGFIIVTATAVEAGAVTADIGTVTKILTPTAGWQFVTNATAAAVGTAAETDAALRERQDISQALNSYTTLGGLVASVENLTGVTYVKAYENDTDTTDINGLPEHSISLVVQGGDATEIAQAILNKKGEGVATFGNTTVAVPDVTGTLRDINFSVPTMIPIEVALTLEAGVNYTTTIAAAIKQAITDYINNMDVGEDLVVIRLAVPAQLGGADDSETYELTILEACELGGTLGTANIVVGFDERATCAVADVTITVI